MTMNILTEIKGYELDFEPRPMTPEKAEEWCLDEIRGRDGFLWPYSDTHLVVAFLHAWRIRSNAHGKVVWSPAARSPKARRFEALAGKDAVKVQDCDEATGYIVPHRYLTRALKMMAPD